MTPKWCVFFAGTVSQSLNSDAHLNDAAALDPIYCIGENGVPVDQAIDWSGPIPAFKDAMDDDTLPEAFGPV